MEGIELISFQIISNVGTAKSMYIQAIQKAKNNDFEEAERLMQEGTEVFGEGHKAHGSLIRQEASGNLVDFSLLLMHAEDQLMTAETFKIVAQEFIDLYRQINSK